MVYISVVSNFCGERWCVFLASGKVPDDERDLLACLPRAFEEFFTEVYKLGVLVDDGELGCDDTLGERYPVHALRDGLYDAHVVPLRNKVVEDLEPAQRLHKRLVLGQERGLVVLQQLCTRVLRRCCRRRWRWCRCIWHRNVAVEDDLFC